MNVVFVSNLYTPHQAPFSKSLNRIVDSFVFVETKRRDNENLPVGWRYDGKLPDYVYEYSQIEEAKIKEKAEARNSTVEAFKEMVDKNEYFKTMIEDEIVSKKFMDFIETNATVKEETWDEEKMMAEQMAKQIENNTEKAEETKEKSAE